jgi:hypothetical protein
MEVPMVQVTVRAADEYNSLTSILLEHRQTEEKEMSLDVLKRIISERNSLICEFKEHQNEEWAKTLLHRLGNKKIMLDCGLKAQD